MESMRKPRTESRPADYENGMVETPRNTPFNAEAVEAAASRVRSAASAAELRKELTKSTRILQGVDAWDSKPTQDDILAFHHKASDLARHLTDPRESGNGD